MTIKTYSDTFWGGDLSSTAGYDALHKRNQESKKMCSELEDYLKKRSKLEADYSKSLSSLSKCFKQRDEVGVLEATLNKLKQELEARANHHTHAANQFQQKADLVKKFKDEQTISRKAKEESLQKVQSTKITQLNKTIQLEKTYNRKCSERDTAKATLKDMNANTTPQKDIEKARKNAAKSDDEAEKADTTYKSAVMVLADYTVQWENEMKTTCQTIQLLDEDRLKFLREEIWETLNIDSGLALKIDMSCEEVRDILEKCDIVSDIQAFIVKDGTGETHPAQYQYKPYNKLSLSDTDSIGSDSSNPYSTIGEESHNGISSSGSGKKNILGILTKKSSSTSS
ncbi:proline-serine-threonine phosphatase-interacting protein 1-like [Physella acuta]|uniref:proline-serine-threonine phosphatase-interacting protein 1-like n=1 Tax=Physella acuta TaxID=109671 RepID=UPI0027DAC758|nr:proline-serine-threonine phosphatase-interacting protein 1-like [Physella acuta]XP_059170550.1 proline-serine-threonine phosphatase-interacting protein 1-like [Physella acuta]